jgi:trk system potassium uptake protein TrkH
MATIVSTTGLANWDFQSWPAEAQGILFICYLLGGCVGSTAGGLKVTRYIVASKYLYNELKLLLTGEAVEEFEVDGVTYNRHSAGLISATMTVYYMLFLGGAIALMVSDPVVHLVDGTTRNLDFTTAISSSIANLGNIGPAVALGSLNAGPTGNYFAFTEIGKIILIILMFVGRVGVLSVLSIFITKKGELNFRESVSEFKFNPEEPQLRR